MTTLAAPASDLLGRQRAYWNTGATRSLEFRLDRLKALREAILTYQADIIDAARQDLGRPEFEACFEIGTIGELDYAVKHLPRWVKRRKVSLSLGQKPGSAWVQPDPLGVVLIIGPWNYPFQLIISPLIGAIAAGNCAILKPSELAPATSKVLARLVEVTFDPAHVALVEGGVDTAQALLAETFDHIFFTGGERVGKIVMQAAAQHLTPVTLELGGKSPCIVDVDVNMEVAARRIRTTAGSVCINDGILQVAVWDLPFGGVGSSGMGCYHGQYSFDTFSHLKSVLKKPFWIDMDWRYPPYEGKLKQFRKFIGLP